MKTFKTRHQFYLTDDLSAKLDALALKPGASKTAILTDALAAWLERKAGHELDMRFGARLDRQARAAERTERKADIMIEALGVFVRVYLTAIANQPAFDRETQLLGSQRFDEFVALVGKRMTKAPLAERLAGGGSGGGGNGEVG